MTSSFIAPSSSFGGLFKKPPHVISSTSSFSSASIPSSFIQRKRKPIIPIIASEDPKKRKKAKKRMEETYELMEQACTPDEESEVEEIMSDWYDQQCTSIDTLKEPYYEGIDYSSCSNIEDPNTYMYNMDSFPFPLNEISTEQPKNINIVNTTSTTGDVLGGDLCFWTDIENSDVEGGDEHVDYLPYFDFFRSETTTAYQEYEEFVYVPELWQSYADPRYEKREVKGDELLRKIKAGYDLFPHTPTPQQRQMLEAALKTNLTSIYGDSWEMEKARVMKDHEWTTCRPELLMVTPRRFGKTWGIAMHCVLMLTSIPFYDIVLFAVRLRQTKMLLGLIKQMFDAHPYSKSMRIITLNKEEMSVAGPEGDQRTVKAFPSSTQVRIFIIYLFIFIIPRNPFSSSGKCGKEKIQ